MCVCTLVSTFVHLPATLLGRRSVLLNSSLGAETTGRPPQTHLQYRLGRSHNFIITMFFVTHIFNRFQRQGTTTSPNM